MTFSTIVRTDMDSVVACFKANQPIKIFHHQDGWSVECSKGLLVDFGTDKFSALEPLIAALKSNGIDRVALEL
jgi:hypothetical protein